MAKFVSVLGVIIIISGLLSLIWPRVSPWPRPEPLQRLHDAIVATTPGQRISDVLGVSSEERIVPITPQSIVQSVTDSLRKRVSDVIVTHAVREITKRFRDLPATEQEKVLNAFSEALSGDTEEASPSQNLSQPSQ